MKLIFVSLLVGFSAVTLAAQSAPKILKQAEQAMGGAKAVRAVTSWDRRGTISDVRNSESGKFFSQNSGNGLYRFGFDVGGSGTEYAYNGRSAWTRDTANGLRTLTGDAGLVFQAEAAFRNSLWLDAKKEKFRVVAGGKSTVGDRPVDVIHLNTPKGSKISLSIDSSSKLVLREVFNNGSASRVYEYGDYRRVAGVQVPHRIRVDLDGPAVAGGEYDVLLEEVRASVNIAKSDFDFPKASGEPLPDIPTLLQELQANEDKVEEMLDTYSYVQRSTRRELGKDGILRDKESETFQLSFYKGRRIRRLIEKNGKPLNSDQQADEDKEVAKRIEEIEKDIAKSEEKGGPPSSEDSRRVSIAEVLRASTLKNPRRERFRGRDVIVFDFEPNPSFDYKNAKSMLKFFGKTAGAMWIDEKDKQVARLEAFLADSYNVGGGLVAKLKKGATFTLEQERVNDEIWLPSVADINLSVRVFLVKGIDLNQVIRSYDYRKFTTEVRDAKVNQSN